MREPSRRSFLNQTLGSGAAAALAGFTAGGLSRATVAKAQASDRVRVACVGVEGRAGFLLSTFAKQPDVDLVAIADVDTRRLPKAVETVASITGKSPQAEADFRRLIDRKDIDVVVVGTPDHWHAIPTIMACQAGKDVYVEKPDGHNIVEGQRMVSAMKKHGRIVQLGTQARTTQHFRDGIEFVRSGKLGTCLFAKAWETARQGSIGKPADTDPPEGVDYDFWLGSAPLRPFNPKRFHGNWRWFFDYGTGDLGNDGVHRLDVARWALSVAGEAKGLPSASLPSKVSALGGKSYFDDLQEWPDTLQVAYEFAGPPVRVLTYEMLLWTGYRLHNLPEGSAVYGDQGYIVFSNTSWTAYGPKNELLAEGKGPNDGVSHIRNFLDCVKSREKPHADLETVGHPSSVLCHAGNISWRVGRTLQLDAATESFIGDAEANALRTRAEFRKPWTLPDV
jgi:predicted dehydrogenase